VGEVATRSQYAPTAHCVLETQEVVHAELAVVQMNGAQAPVALVLATLVHVPVEHELQEPLHEVLQQRPSAQKLLVHCVPEVHVPPSAFFATQVLVPVLQ
jgi:hypothetical protein